MSDRSSLAAAATGAPAPASRSTNAPGAKPRRFGSWYVAEHRVRAMRAYGVTIIATSIGNPLVYLFALGVGLAALVDANAGAGAVGAVSYLAFVAPALLASAAVTVAVEEFSYPVMMGFKWNPIFFGMNAAPISPQQITNGLIISVVARMLPTVAVYFGFLLAFGAVPSVTGALAILIATLTGMSIGILVMAYTATITQDKGQLALMMRFIITPMFLFSGTFFPLEQLPIFLRWIGWISPLWHGTELSRVATYGLDEPLWLSIVHVLYLGGLAVFGWKSSQRTIERRLNR